MTNPERISDEQAKRFKLWFFRDLSDDQRLALFRLTMHEVPADQLRTHAAQTAALEYSLARRSPPAQEGMVTVKPLEWASEPPYSVARPQRLWHYSTKAIWEDGVLQTVWLGGTFGASYHPTVEAAKAAAQADYEARIRSALAPAPDAVKPRGRDMTDDKQDPSVVAWRFHGPLGWIAVSVAERPPGGDEWEPLSLTSGLTAMKAELEEALNRAQVAGYKLDQAVNTVQPMIVARAEAAEQERDELREALSQIVQWADAYPLNIFPEPDFAKAHELLKAGGMTLAAISASNMRHVVEGVGNIARAALSKPKPHDETRGRK